MRTAPVALLLLLSTAASAQVCSANALTTELQYFRRLSLDLRGRVPTIDELDALSQASRVTPAAIDGILTNADAKLFPGKCKEFSAAAHKADQWMRG